MTVAKKLSTKYRKYLSFFRLRFTVGLQYRAAALAGIATQFAWGFMQIKVFAAFYDTNPGAAPMLFGQLATYLWLQQAFLAFFMMWMMEVEIFDCITSGNIAYELCRPVNIYNMWFARSLATRMSRALLRCFPIIIVAFFLPEPYRMYPPANAAAAVSFVITMLLGLTVTVAMCMIVYMLTFFTISSTGLRLMFSLAGELLEGAIIPLPFFPDKIRRVIELLPFAAMQNVPLRAYTGNIDGRELMRAAALQIFWSIMLVAAGKLICARAMKKTTIQGS